MMPPRWTQDVYIKAWNFATMAHDGQTFGGPAEGQRINYINHIGNVTMEVIYAIGTDYSLNGDFAIQCALLHDTIEDTAVDFANIEANFGLEVAQGVQALTKDKQYPSKREQMLDSLNRIRLQPREVWMVKLADRISNLGVPPFYWNSEKRQTYRDEALLIYEHLHEGNKILAQRLLTRIEAYKEYI